MSVEDGIARWGVCYYSAGLRKGWNSKSDSPFFSNRYLACFAKCITVSDINGIEISGTNVQCKIRTYVSTPLRCLCLSILFILFFSTETMRYFYNCKFLFRSFSSLFKITVATFPVSQYRAESDRGGKKSAGLLTGYEWHKGTPRFIARKCRPGDTR